MSLSADDPLSRFLLNGPQTLRVYCIMCVDNFWTRTACLYTVNCFCHFVSLGGVVKVIFGVSLSVVVRGDAPTGDITALRWERFKYFFQFLCDTRKRTGPSTDSCGNSLQCHQEAQLLTHSSSCSPGEPAVCHQGSHVNRCSQTFPPLTPFPLVKREFDWGPISSFLHFNNTESLSNYQYYQGHEATQKYVHNLCQSLVKYFRR